MKPLIRSKPKSFHSKATYTSACIMEVETSSTEPCGGDAGHGSRAVLKMSDLASVCWTVTLADESGDTVVIDCPRSVSIEVAGDCEQGVLLAALEGNSGIVVRHRLPITACLCCGAGALFAGLGRRS
jgi:hypothetical protein